MDKGVCISSFNMPATMLILCMYVCVGGSCIGAKKSLCIGWCTYSCIYIHTLYLYRCLCLIYVYIYVYIDATIYVSISISMFVSISIPESISVPLSLSARTHADAFVCLFVFVYAFISLCGSDCVRVDPYARRYVCVDAVMFMIVL